MASEIRVNKINNRVGLGTVTYTDTGIVVSGIVTTTASDISGHTDIGSNLNVAGISTFNNAINVANGTISRTSTGSKLILSLIHI